MKKNILLQTISLSLVSVAFSLNVNASENANSTMLKQYPTESEIQSLTEQAPNVFDIILQNGEEIIAHFNAEKGYDGYVIESNGQNAILYYDKSKDVLFSGTMIDGNGDNLSQIHHSQQIPQKDYSNVLSEIQEANTFITEGSENAPAEIYVFLDPECPHCHTIWQNTRNMVESGELKIHWLPLAFLTDDSLGKVAAFVQSNNPVQTLNEGKENFRNGGIEPLPESEILDSTRVLTTQNSQFLRDLDSNGTPTIVYKNNDGTVNAIRNSIPESEIERLVKSISKN